MEELLVIDHMTREMKKTAATLSTAEARYLVRSYYQMQANRVVSGNQESALDRSEDSEEEIPQQRHVILSWLTVQNTLLEKQIKSVLGKWANADPVGVWAQSIVGIGPVISAGLLAHIDINKAPTVGHIWRYAGLDPTSKWNKGEKRPWNADLKTLCWKIGESFMKFYNHKDDIYGKVYITRKLQEEDKNNQKLFADQAKEKLERFRIDPKTAAYKCYIDGRLPPAHINERAKRYAVKLFLSHFHHVLFVAEFKKDPPRPYIIEHGGHVNFIKPPNF